MSMHTHTHAQQQPNKRGQLIVLKIHKLGLHIRLQLGG